MARNLKSANSGSPASFVSGRHDSATIRQTRLIRLGRAANDNRSPRRHRLVFLTTTAMIAAVIILAFLI